MYGMVNEGIRTFILTNHGAEAWRRICARAGVQEAEFEKMTSYEDELTYKLVDAVGEFTGLDAQDVLKVFGKYWVDFAGGSGFRHLMRLSGPTFIEQVRGLDDLHDRIILSMPHLKPPSFELEDLGGETFLLHYYSDRDGLAPMVEGLLHGIAKDTGEEIDVEQVAFRSEGADHDVFRIRLLA
ncbi:heme NO-binding protein [Rhodobacterales bacterium]|nr:heme NO-binding protein [Rhodobacterales bacterium]